MTTTPPLPPVILPSSGACCDAAYRSSYPSLPFPDPSPWRLPPRPHAARRNPSYHRSPTPHASSVLSIYCPAPPLVCRPTTPCHVSARAAPGSALVVLLRLSNLDSDAAHGSASHSSSDPLFSYTIWFFLWQAGPYSLPAIMMTIHATLTAHPDPLPRALACTGINVTTLRKSEDA